MPRVRNWKDLNFYRVSAVTRFRHIEALFGEPGRNVIDWDLIERHYDDLMRVVLSVAAGKISSVTWLRRLSTYSRRNNFYRAFREVGRVIRTIQLLRYLSDPQLRAADHRGDQQGRVLQQLLRLVPVRQRGPGPWQRPRRAPARHRPHRPGAGVLISPGGRRRAASRKHPRKPSSTTASRLRYPNAARASSPNPHPLLAPLPAYCRFPSHLGCTPSFSPGPRWPARPPTRRSARSSGR
jgi:Tn3 transposase DDE domain